MIKYNVAKMKQSYDNIDHVLDIILLEAASLKSCDCFLELIGFVDVLTIVIVNDKRSRSKDSEASRRSITQLILTI